jgi:hypothetical protein
MKKSQITLCLEFNKNKFKVPELLISSRSLDYNQVYKSSGYTEININDVPFGAHDLTLKLLNKDNQDTVVDENGKIIDDLYISLQSLKIDQFDITQKINNISRYYDNQGNEIFTNGWMSFAQDYLLWLQAPGWYFARNISILTATDIKNYIQTSLIANN